MRVAIHGFLLGASLLAGLAHAEDYRVAPAPTWVTKIAVPGRTIPSPTASGHVYGLLADIQEHRAIEPPEAYHHFALQAVNELGVPEISQIAVAFNPAFQTLLLHEVTIHRGGTDIAVPIRGHVKVLQREDRLEDQIYDGTLTAVLLVEDVRPGDIVEWSFTLRGANPVLASHYAAEWSTAGVNPLALMHRRLLWPAARPLRVMPLANAVRPAVTRLEGVIEYKLLIRDVPQVDVEPGVPSWYDPLHSILFSDLDSWEDVARWGTTLFEAPPTLTPELRARVAEFARSGLTSEERAMAAVRFVQNEIRYLGIEIGENSHRASPPGAVLARRFGDCKDKALLLVTFLRALGFEAHTALVNTNLRDSVSAFGPSVLMFDHVIVRTRSQGRTYWVDATDAGQRGDAFARMAPPRFGLALVLGDESTRGLSRIEPDGSLALTTIEKTMDATRFDAPATLTIRTSYFGDGAAVMRLRMLASGREEMTRSFVEYYRQNYPKILELEPVRVEDDERLNRLAITEQYSIPEFWQKDEDDGEPYADFSAIELMSEVPSWRSGRRLMPLRLASPHRTIYTASIQLPHEMDDLPEDETVRTPALEMTTRKASTAEKYSIYHEFVRTRDYLTAEEAVAAVEKFESMELSLVTELGRSPGRTGGGPMAFLPWLVALMAAALALLCVVRLAMAPVPAAIWPNTSYDAGTEPWTPDQPIGGWLYVLGLSFIISPFTLLYQVGTSLRDTAEIVGLGLTGANAKFEIVGLIETALVTALFVYVTGLLFLFARRRRVFFRGYVGLIALSLVVQVYDIVGLQIVNPGDPEIARQATYLVTSLFTYGIWCLYFTKSRRVEATFVR